MRAMQSILLRLCFALALLSFVAACTGETQPAGDMQTTEEIRNRQGGRIFGDALTFGGPRRRTDAADGAAAGIGVNSFLWRASLDTLSFMPLASADPFGGVIITEWYSPAETPDERYKVTVYILDRDLRSDGIRASVFRQTRDATRGWVDAQTAADTGVKLEDRILTRARELRIALAGN
jgi:Domain of unknown function (DUF3576)